MKMKKRLETFCPYPWMHMNASNAGCGRLCSIGTRAFEDRTMRWENVNGLHPYFNSEEYKKVRIQMLNGVQPNHCETCFVQEKLGGKSVRQCLNDEYRPYIDDFIRGTRTDGSIEHPKIFTIEISLGNKCNTMCRMCTPEISFPISKDWEKMGKEFDYDRAKKTFTNKWYASSGCFNLIKESLSTLKLIYFLGGEPMIIDEHIEILRMIIDAGYAGRITVRYNSNQKVIPKKVTELWKYFKGIEFHCSVEAQGILNDYIRYPSIWKDLEKNIYYLDEMAGKGHPPIKIIIASTFQAYNVPRIPEFLDYLKNAKFKNVYRFPLFFWVSYPRWLSPSVFPRDIKEKMADRILKKIDEHEIFFCTYNKYHKLMNQGGISILRSLAQKMKNTCLPEEFHTFIRETISYDRVRNQSITSVLPELAPFFN